MELKHNGTYKGFLQLLAAVFITIGITRSHAQASQGDLAGEIPFTVVLDAGHGGHDPGNLGNGFLEKDIALNIVLEAGKSLKNDPNVKVLFTRDDDTFVDLYKRGEIANKAKADLFVSVHCDSHSSDAHGAGTFVLGLHANKQNFDVAKKENSVIYLEDNYESRYADYDINSPESVIGLTIMQEEFLDQSVLLGTLMQERFTGNLKRKDRKVKQAGFIVLHQTFMPSVLIETGFLTNKNEGRYLNSKKGQEEMGGAIAGAILAYRNAIRSNSTSLIADIPGALEQDTSDPNINAEQAEVANDPQEKQPMEEAVAAKEINDSGLSADDLPTMDSSDIKDPGVGDEKTGTEIKAADSDSANTGLSVEQPVVKEGNADKATDLTFKVQLMAVSQDMALTPENFKGLNTLSKEPVNNMYRILYGNTDSYEQAQILQAGARQKGFEQAYIVAYKKGKRIPIEQALQDLGN